MNISKKDTNTKNSINYDSREILATNVKYYRFQKHWSQPDLSNKSKVAVETISYVENMTHEVGIDTVAALAKAFNMTIAELLTDYGYKVTKKRVDER